MLCSNKYMQSDKIQHRVDAESSCVFCIKDAYFPNNWDNLDMVDMMENTSGVYIYFLEQEAKWLDLLNT